MEQVRDLVAAVVGGDGNNVLVSNCVTSGYEVTYRTQKNIALVLK